MNKNKTFFYSFLFVWIILIILNFIKPKETFSEEENRMLAKIPSFSFEKLVSGEYAKDLDTYINDHFVFRDIWLKIQSFCEIALGKKENNNVYIGEEGYLFEKVSISDKNLENIKIATNIMNEFAKKVDIEIYGMIIPNSIYINQDKLPENVIVDNQEQIINALYKNMGDIKTIDVVSVIKQNNKGDLYFKTDHHMTSKGAYVVYNEFCRNVGLRTKQIEEFNIRQVSNNFLGTFDSKAQVPWQEKDIIEIYENEKNTNLKEVIYDNETTKSITNSEYLTKKDQYSYFLNGNNSKVVIKTKQENGKKLLVIKDSYAHNMAQFFCQDYEEIHLIDPRYYRAELNKYIAQNQITQCLFLYNFSNLLTDVGIRNVR